MASVEHFDVVVVGSGFGGSVIAYRLAEAKRSVCLLERGKAYPPGSFPRTPHRMKQNFWDPSEGLHGMYNAWSFEGLGGLVASGLGGGSLIYANVLIRKDEKWFVQEDAKGGYEPWPVQRADLEPHYDRAEKVLGGVPYPYADTTAKTVAMRDAARALGLEWKLPKLAVTFARPGEAPRPGAAFADDNLHHADRETCRLCGECDVGCNYGSKNTLDYTYLSAAARAKADIRTRCEVRSFAPRQAGGYDVEYIRHVAENEGRATDTKSLPVERLSCDVLVLSAGAFGSPYLLFKNRAALPGLGAGLGARFSENGDLLTFVLRSRDDSARDGFRVIEASRGPVITSAIRVPDALDGGGGRGYYIEDAGFPEFVAWIAQVAEGVTGVGRAARFGLKWVRHYFGLDAKSDLSSDFSDFFGACALEKSTLPLLGMGRDTPDGRMKLDAEGFLEIDWGVRGSEPFFDDMRETMQRIAVALRADFMDDPVWHLSRVITVHPLGGAPMARSSAEGVVNAWGEVFGHSGLYVADGSVMPGPVGPNPSLTIAALADRFADGILFGHP